MFESLGMTWDAISQYELLQSQHQQEQRQKVAQQHQFLHSQNNIAQQSLRPTSMMPGHGPPRPSQQTATPFFATPLVQQQQQQQVQPFIGTPAEWDGRKCSAPKRQKTAAAPPMLVPLPQQQFNFQMIQYNRVACVHHSRQRKDILFEF